MWMRYAAFPAPVVLVAALAAAIVLTSDAGPQPTVAATVARQGVGDPGAAPQPDPQTTPAPCENSTVVPDPASNPGLVADCEILLVAKDTLRGTATLDWDDVTAISNWTGITLGGTPQRVTRVEVSYASLDGTIPAALAGLEELQHLGLGSNALTGTIPAELGGLTRLVRLDLSDNQLTGALPPELGTLELLVTLTADGNLLTGTIPEALFGLTHLDYVGLSGNQLTGSIPPIRDDRADMQGIVLDDNQLSGPIPLGLGELDLSILELSGNQLTGCIPQRLRTIGAHDLDDLGLPDCTTTATRTLTTSASVLGSISPLPGRYLYLRGTSVTVTATPDAGHEVARWIYDCASAITATNCTLTLDADKTTHVVFKPSLHRLRVTKTGNGTMTPEGRSFIEALSEATVTASWDDATHDLSWGGDCAGTTGSVCTLTMDANKTVTATFAALPADRCEETTDADCIRAVYRGAPEDYAQVADIPADVLLTPDADGRYRVERGQQVTVVTAAPLPAGYTRFWLDWSPLEYGTPSPTSFTQLIQPVGTTYTFTPTDDEDGATLITFDLTAARPHPVRPTHKPELGDVVVTTKFLIPKLRYNRLDITGAAATAGRYAFLTTAGDATSAIQDFGHLPMDGVELRIHPADASGTSRADSYDTVEVGDTFDYRTNGLGCAFRFKVTSVALGAIPGTFGIEYVRAYGGWCGEIVDDPGAAKDVEFVWRVRPGIPGPDGVRVLLRGETAGEGAYRLARGVPWVLDVPAGMHLIQDGIAHLTYYHLPPPPNAPRAAVKLVDADTGSWFSIDPETGREIARSSTSPAVDALFDQILASLRLVE